MADQSLAIGVTERVDGAEPAEMAPPGRRGSKGVDLRFSAPAHGAAAAEGIAEQAAQAIGVVSWRRVQRQKLPRDARTAR